MATRLQQMPEAFQRHHSERAAEEQPQISTQASQPRPPSQVGSQTSEDSQTVVLNHSDAQAKPADSKSSQDGESLHCWICLMDEPLTEREAGNWKEPCSCNLTAHEECLFQWIVSKLLLGSLFSKLTAPRLLRKTTRRSNAPSAKPGSI